MERHNQIQMPEIVLQPVVENIDDVAEPYRGSYEEREGKFVLTKPIKFDDAAELKSSLARERDESGKLRQTLSKYKDLPDDVQERLRKLDEYDQREAERKGEYQQLLQKNEQKYSEKLQEKDKRIDVLQSTIEETMIVNAATIALNTAGGDVEGLLPHIRPHLGAIEDPDKPGVFTVYVKDTKDPSKPRMGTRGQEMTVEELVGEFREHKVLSKLFNASPANGSGGGGNRFGTVQKGIVKLTAEEAKDPALYRRLKAQKEKGEIEGAVDHQGRRLV